MRWNSLCGIAGEIRFDGSVCSAALIKSMCDAEFHRGPDDDGYFTEGPVGLGIRRLAIIDLTKGLYPLSNENGHIRLVFNGEIYGFQNYKEELEKLGHRFSTKTDAEVLVHAYEEWGPQCLKRIDGMFAFALWDGEKRELWAARDHFGIKPFYYYRDKRFFAFASEIKPLLQHPEVSVKPNESLIEQYLLTSLVDTSAETFFQGIKRLESANQVFVSPDGSIKVERYWVPNVSRTLNGNILNEEISKTRQLFLDAVRTQLVSDVPVGTCLSGGIDSSSVVCAVRNADPNAASIGERIKTFSAVFPGEAIDEEAYVRAVCEFTGAEQNPVTPQAEELWRDLPMLVKCQEEPFVSTSIYAQWRVMKRAKERGMTVMLDGQGGDELLCGYIPYYLHYFATLKKNRKWVTLMKESLLSYDLTKQFLNPYVKSLAKRFLNKITKSKIQRLSDRSDVQMHSILSVGRPENVARGIDSVEGLAETLERQTAVTSLPALLRYEDKNSMWHSIEARVPFLDRPFFEYAASLPLNRKLRNGWTKYIFRAAMKGILPDKVRLRRSKVGFETPEKNWIQGVLRQKIKDFFAGRSLRATKFYDVNALMVLLDKHALTTAETSLIWRILNLEIWYSLFFP